MILISLIIYQGYYFDILQHLIDSCKHLGEHFVAVVVAV
jgi:hypothetical protein